MALVLLVAGCLMVIVAGMAAAVFLAARTPAGDGAPDRVGEELDVFLTELLGPRDAG